MTRTLLAAAAALASLSLAAFAAAQPADGLRPLEEVDTFSLPQLDTDAMRVAARALEGTGGPYKFAEPFETQINHEVIGTWDSTADGEAVYRLVVKSPEAVSLNLGFTDFFLPDGAEMYLYGAGSNRWLGPITDEVNKPHREYWTPVIPGDRLVIEVQVPAKRKDDLTLEIGSVNHGFRGFTPDAEKTGAEKSGSCNVDVACPQRAGWEDQIRSVAVYSIQGTFACTGALVNNTAQDRRQLFLTADHCTVSSSNDSSVVLYWNYENSTCRAPGSPESGLPGDGPLDQFSSGTTLLADYPTSDFTLLEVDDPIDPAFEVYYAGWDARDFAPATAVAIHHPSTDEKRISFEDDPTSISSYLDEPGLTPGTHVKVTDWDLGTTEPGSSGSPLFDGQTKLIVGQLHGGFAACGNNLADWYGRMFRSWTGGGSSSSRLSDWLDPIGTGALSLQGLDGKTIRISATDIADGDDGFVLPGETGIELIVTVENPTGTLGPASTIEIQNIPPTVSFSATSSAVPQIPAGESRTNSTQLFFSLDELHPCGQQFEFDVVLTAPNFSQTITVPVLPAVPTGESTLQSNLAAPFFTADLQTRTATFTVTEQGRIADVIFSPNMNHTWMADIIAELEAPDGTRVILISGRGGSGDNMDQTRFDDEAPSLIGSASPPFTGFFRPETPLSAFDGRSMTGTWTLYITDTAQQDGGEVLTESAVNPLIKTGLTITYQNLTCSPSGLGDRWQLY